MKTCKKGIHQYNPVKNSHIGCPECHKNGTKVHYTAHKESIKKRVTIYANDHKKEVLVYKKTYRLKNKDKLNEKNKIYYNKPEIKKHKKNYAKQYAINNPHTIVAKLAKRRSNKLLAMPNWLSKTQMCEIQEFYRLAKELSWLSESPLEVDHIIPLQGKNVSGLHVPWNLQILPKSMNQSKGNRVQS